VGSRGVDRWIHPDMPGLRHEGSYRLVSAHLTAMVVFMSWCAWLVAALVRGRRWAGFAVAVCLTAGAVTGVAPAGAGPVSAPAPVTSRERHARAPGADGLRPGGRAAVRRSSTPWHGPWRDAPARPRAAAGTGPVNVQLKPGFDIGVTSLNAYFEIPASDGATSFLIAIFADEFGDDFDVTDEVPLPAFACRQRPGYCVTLFGGNFFGALVPGRTYFIIVEAFGPYPAGHADSALSTGAVAAAAPVPAALPAAQTYGAGSDNASGRTGPTQVFRGEPVNTATGAYVLRSVDLSMPGLGWGSRAPDRTRPMTPRPGCWVRGGVGPTTWAWRSPPTAM
jgi:hypothetical protein